MTGMRLRPVQWIQCVILLLLFLTVLPKGGNSELVRGLIVLLAGALVLTSGPTEARQWWWMLPSLVLAGVVVVQTFFAPTLDPILQSAYQHYRSINWLLLSASYAAIAMVVASLDRQVLRFIAVSLVLMLSFEVLYGIIAQLGDHQFMLGWWPKEYYLDSATGTFVNRNHYAGFMAMLWPVALVVLRPFSGPHRGRLLRTGLALLLSLLVIVALVLSKSRMGSFVGLVGLVVWSMTYLEADRAPRAARIALPTVVILLALLAALWFGVDAIGRRFTYSSESLAFRASIWTQTFEFPWAWWLLGIGPGQFPDLFPLVQDFQQIPSFVYAHNDYLQFVLEIGIVGSLLTVIAMVVSARRLWPEGAVMDRWRWAAVAGLLAVALHSIVDFDLHMPGFSVWAWILVGLVFNPEWGHWSRRREGSRAHRPTSWQFDLPAGAER